MRRAIREVLGDFTRAIGAAAPELFEVVAPGLGVPDVGDGLAPLTAEPPDELVALYQWRNGYAPEVGAWRPLFLGWMPVRLDRAVATRELLNGVREESARRYGSIVDVDRSGWLGIFEQTEDLVLNADLNDVGAGGTVPIYRSYVKDVETRLVANSLSELIDAWTAMLSAGVTWTGGRWDVPSSVDPSLITAAGY
jgi:hypothetical protein